MPKLKEKDQFIDLSDYGRFFGKFLAKSLQYSKYTPIHVTLLFGFCGIVAIICMWNEYYISAALLLLLKSGIDAADGELARIKNTPSYSGRYLDSIFDFVLNFLFLATITHLTNASFILFSMAFFSMQLQGTLYNYYYVIIRNNAIGGDSTSKIFENKIPTALPGETQKAVTILFKIYYVLYGIFDKIIYFFDSEASKSKRFPNWFMTLLSVYGLGFQLLLIAVLLATGNIFYVLNILIFMGFPVLLFIGVRKYILC